MIPVNKKVSGIEIVGIQQQELKGTYNLMPTQPGKVPDLPDPGFYPADAAVYKVNAFYPADPFINSGAGFMAGVHVSGLQFYPLRYNPVTKKMVLTTSVTFKLIYSDEINTPIKPLRLMSAQQKMITSEVKNMVVNPAEVETNFQPSISSMPDGMRYSPSMAPDYTSQLVSYVIITNEVLAPGFEDSNTKSVFP